MSHAFKKGIFAANGGFTGEQISYNDAKNRFKVTCSIKKNTKITY